MKFFTGNGFDWNKIIKQKLKLARRVHPVQSAEILFFFQFLIFDDSLPVILILIRARTSAYSAISVWCVCGYVYAWKHSLSTIGKSKTTINTINHEINSSVRIVKEIPRDRERERERKQAFHANSDKTGVFCIYIFQLTLFDGKCKISSRTPARSFA